MLTQGSCAEEEISGGEEDAPEAIPNGEVVNKDRAEGSTPANRPMGELHSDGFTSALDTQAKGVAYNIFSCSVYGGKALPADACHQEGSQGGTLEDHHSQEGHGCPA